MPTILTSLFLLCACTTTAVGAATQAILVDAGIDRSGWRFHDGGEFPGASGRLEVDPEGVSLVYDFSKGGSYVAADFRAGLPPDTGAVTFRCTAAQACRVNWRWTDGSGRVFQGAGRDLVAGEATEIRVERAGPWPDAWGGSADTAPGDPVTVSLLVVGDPKAPTGAIRLNALHADPGAEGAVLEPALILDPIRIHLAGWALDAVWVPQWRRPLLRGTATRSEGAPDGTLALRLPRNGRAQVQTWPLRDRIVPFTFTPALIDGGHPAARYGLDLEVATADTVATRRLLLSGRHCLPWTVGAPRPASAIPPSSIFGVCTHFSMARSGAFAGWRDHVSLLDRAAAAGLTWIRDGVKVLKDERDAWTMDPHDLTWIRAARERGIRVILVIDMRSDDGVDPAAFAARCAAIAAQTRDLVEVFELGNEPNNFGGWRKAFGGTWNGKVDAGSDETAEWVKAHVRATNAGAEAIKAVRPEATVIGLGSPSCVNVRALREGLSTAVDGIVDHPYAFALPPELVPFGTGFAARDGVSIGDDGNTFLGLMAGLEAASREAGHPRSTWITEFGWPTYRFDGENEQGLYAAYSEAAQAAYLVRRHLLGLRAGVAVSCQYALLDDYGSAPGNAEANFGIIRGDGSVKPAYRAIARLCALVGGASPATDVSVVVEAAPLHRAARSHVLIKDWDGVTLRADGSVQVLALRPADGPARLTLALWSAVPWTEELAPRHVRLRIPAVRATGNPVAIGLISGDVYDLPGAYEAGDLILRLEVGAEPIAIQIFE